MALPVLLTSTLLGSAIEENSMLKDKFAIPGIMMPPLPKFRNLTNNNWFWSILLGLCMMIIFCLVPFIPLVILREQKGFNFFPYSIFWVSPNVENYSHSWTISYAVALLSIILRAREANSPFLSRLYWGVTGSRHVNSSEPVM